MTDPHALAALVARLKAWLAKRSEHVEQAYMSIEWVEQIVAALAAAPVPPATPQDKAFGEHLAALMTTEYPTDVPTDADISLAVPHATLGLETRIKGLRIADGFSSHYEYGYAMAIKDVLGVLSTPLIEGRTAGPGGTVSNEVAIFKDRRGLTPASSVAVPPATEGETPQEQRDRARGMARRIVGNCSGESLVEAIADIAMFGEHDPLKPWHVRAHPAALPAPALHGETLEERRVAAYRAMRTFEPSMDGYAAAMAVYRAAFGDPSGELAVSVAVNANHADSLVAGLPSVAELITLVHRQCSIKAVVERRQVERTKAHERLINARDEESKRRAQVGYAAAQEAVKLAANDFVNIEHDMYRAAEYLRAALAAPVPPLTEQALREKAERYCDGVAEYPSDTPELVHWLVGFAHHLVSDDSQNG